MFALLSTGCGAGVAAIAAGSGSSGGGNAPPVLTGIQVDNTRVGPAEISFRVVDSDAVDALDVAVYYVESSGEPMLIARLEQLPSAPLPGTLHSVSWDFTADFGTALTDPIHIIVARMETPIDQVEERAEEGVNKLAVTLGDDPPLVTLDVANIEPGGETTGIVAVSIELRDSSNDEVDVRVEYLDGLGVFRPARPTGLAPGAPTPRDSFESITALLQGTNITFAWDSLFDLAGAEQETQLRVTLQETAAPELESLAALSKSFRIDNNTPPALEISVLDLLLNSDRVGGIPVPFVVSDPDGDRVDVLFQWTPTGEAFPELPADIEGLRAVLQDPAEQKRLQIASEWKTQYTGILKRVSGANNVVRVSEVANEASPLLGRNTDKRFALVGRDLEVLAPGNMLRPYPLTQDCVQVQPIVDSGRGYHLSSTESGWRLTERRIVDGALLEGIATGDGSPLRLEFERGRRALLILIQHGSRWELVRIDIQTGDRRTLVAPGDGIGTNPRALLSTAVRECYMTVGEALVRINYVSDPTRVEAVMSYAEATPVTPWGLARHPGFERRILLAQHGRDRIVSLNVDTLQASPLTLSVVCPSTLALENESLLLVVTDEDAGDGTVELAATRLQPTLDIDGDGRAERQLEPIQEGLSSSDVRIGLNGEKRVLVFPEAQQLLAGGGIEQKHRIIAFDPRTYSVELEAPLDPVPERGRRWRIQDSARSVFAESAGSRATFVWDSTDALRHTSVLIRGIAFDQDVASPSSPVPKEIVLPEGLKSPYVGGPGVTARYPDLDSDGDRDVVAFNLFDGRFSVHEQVSPRTFAFVYEDTTSGAVDVFADFNGDGLLDLAQAGGVRLQNAQARSTFLAPQNLGQRVSAVGDLDADGELDAIVLAETSTQLYYGRGDGLFGSPSLELPRRVGAAVGDIDLDGDADLILFGPGFYSPSFISYGNLVDIHLQTTGGSFADTPEFSFDVSEFTTGFQLTDIDGDGSLDLALSSDSGSGGGDPSFFGVYLNLYAKILLGNLEMDFTAPPARDAKDCVAMALYDYDGDGDLDGVVTSFRDGFGNGITNTAAYEQTTPGIFSATPRILSGFDTFLDLDEEGFLDLDGDGNVDQGGSPLRFQNRIQPFRQGIGLQNNLGNHGRAANDFDHDGDMDILWVTEEGLTLYPQTTRGRIGARTSFPVGPGLTLRPTDLDGDGRIDLVAGGSSVGVGPVVTAVQTNDGLVAGVTIDVDGTSGLLEIATHDMDGDGVPEILIGSDDLWIFSGDPLNGYSLSARLGRGNEFVVSDFDLDGDLDILERDPDGLALHTQQQPLKFETRTLLQGVDAAAKSAADIDLDGLPDLVISGANVDLYFQNAPNAFEVLRLVDSSFIFGLNVEIDDVDRDGLPDLLPNSSSGVGGTGHFLFLQPMPRRFRLQSAGNAAGIYIDFDGDGRKDFINFGIASATELEIYFGDSEGR